MKFKSINYKELWNNLGGLPAQHSNGACTTVSKRLTRQRDQRNITSSKSMPSSGLGASASLNSLKLSPLKSAVRSSR